MRYARNATISIDGHEIKATSGELTFLTRPPDLIVDRPPLHFDGPPISFTATFEGGEQLFDLVEQWAREPHSYTLTLTGSWAHQVAGRLDTEPFLHWGMPDGSTWLATLERYDQEEASVEVRLWPRYEPVTRARAEEGP